MLAGFVAAAAGPVRVCAAEFWVWHRDSAVSPAEAEELRAAGVTRLLWHVGDLERDGESWRGVEQLYIPAPVPLGIEIVPVVRLRASPDTVEGIRASDAFGQLAEIVASVCRAPGVSEIQIDYDCPDRLLASYARLLSRCRDAVRPARLSATSLAGWIRTDAFREMAASADILYPMFYDLEADRAEDAAAGQFRPMADQSTVTLLREWADSPAEWVAGLPNIARISLFRPDGSLRGHLRSWSWDEIIFHPCLEAVDTTAPLPGVIALRAASGAVIGDTRLDQGDYVVIRRPAAGVLSHCVAEARAAGAGEIAWFRLPGPGETTAWTIDFLAALQAGKVEAKQRHPVFSLARSERGIILENISAVDLPPRFQGVHGEGDRGWQLELDASSPVFADASPGEFVRVQGHLRPETERPVPAPTGAATRLTFWFSHLSAGEAISSPYVALKGEEAWSRLRWRIGSQPWRPMVP